MPHRTIPEPPIYTFRVRILDGIYAPPNAREIWREIEVAANQTLEDLGTAIPDAFGFDDPHLWAFFLSGKAWDEETEYALDGSEFLGDKPTHVAGEARLRDVPFPGKTGKKEFLFLFDFGDQWEFGIKLMGTSNAVAPRASYPRVAASQGEAPPQYPLLSEDGDYVDPLSDVTDDIQDVIARQRALLQDLALVPEQVERVLEPLVALHQELLSEIDEQVQQDQWPVLFITPS